MAQIQLGGEPVFVDVTVGQQQYAISTVVGEFSQVDNFPVPNGEIRQNQLTNSGPVQEPMQNAAPTTAQQETSTSHTTTTSAGQSQDTANTNPCLKIQTRRIRCPECKRFTCETEEKMLRHIRKNHRGENPFQCSMCDYSTYNKVLFEEHVRIHQGIKPYKCSHCPYRSVSKKNTKKHELIHRPDNPLRCKECDFIARNTRVLKCHYKTHGYSENKIKKSKVDNNIIIECPNCPFQYTTVEQLRNHKKNRRKCDKCDETVCSKALLTAHMLREHNITVAKVKGPWFKCGLCKWSSNNKPRILLHLIHHPNQTVDEDIVDVSILREHGIMQ